MLNKGDVFWYRSHNKTYGYIVLDTLDKYDCFDDILIAISEEVDYLGNEPTEEEILATRLFTVAWFDSYTILPARRIHFISKLCIDENYENRAGLMISDNGSIYLANIGHADVWRHEDRRIELPNLLMRDTLLKNNIPITRRGKMDSLGKMPQPHSLQNDSQARDQTNPDSTITEAIYRNKGRSLLLAPNETKAGIWIDVNASVTEDEIAIKQLEEVANSIDKLLTQEKEYLNQVLKNKKHRFYKTVYEFLDYLYDNLIAAVFASAFSGDETELQSKREMVNNLLVKRFGAKKEPQSGRLLFETDLGYNSELTDEVLKITITSSGDIIDIEHES